MITFKMELDVPLTSLQAASRNLISLLLNPNKVIATENGLPRDWRGLAHLADIPGEIIPSILNSLDPTAQVLIIWSRKNPKSTLHDLQKYLEMLDRFDVIDDTKELFEQDSKKFRDSYNQNIDRLLVAPEVQQNALSTYEESNVLTVDDVNLAQQGSLLLQFYDAFVLFADKDIHFATELIQRMENYGFKLCIKDRDLLGGLSSEHTAVLRLIAERCARMIIIISPAFLQSPANTFFMNFAQALGIEQRQRKIVPCLYQRCILPPQLSYYFLLDYQRSGVLWNFWEKLRDSLRASLPALTEKNRATVREIEADTSLAALMPCQDPTGNSKMNQINEEISKINLTSINSEHPIRNGWDGSDNLMKPGDTESMVQTSNINSLSVPTSTIQNLSEDEIENVSQTHLTSKKYSKTELWFKNLKKLAKKKKKKMFVKDSPAS